MHEDLLERRLRTALHDEVGRLPFTITAAELERRAVLRGHGVGNRRLGLLLAAAIGIGALGAGGLVGGLFNDPVESSPASTEGVVATRAPAVAPPAALPSLEEMIAAGDPAAVVLAQAHDPFDPLVGEPSQQSFGDPFVELGPLAQGEYEIEFACSGGRGAAVLAGPGLPGPVTTRPCDNSVHRDTVGLIARRGLELLLDDTDAWRVVVRRVGGTGVAPGQLPAPLPDASGRQVLNVVELTMPDGPGWPGTDLPFTELEGLPGRLAYEVDLSCVGSRALRYVFGDEVDGTRIPVTSTEVPCDGALHHARFELAQAFGTRMYVAAEAGATVSLMVSGEQPPVGLVQELPGWQLSAGAGPNLAFDTHTQGFTGPGVEGGGPVLIAVSCAGTGTIEIGVTLQHGTPGPVTETEHAQFDARCEPDGATTTADFPMADDYVDLEYTTTAGTWIAVSILVPDPLPDPLPAPR
jgi:hypothetical protein